MLLLLENNSATSVGPVFRSFFEAFLDVKILLDNPDYCNNLNASYYKEYLRQLYEAKKATNPFLKGISELECLDDTIDEYERTIANLKEKGFTPLTIKDKLDCLGMGDTYSSIYNMLCSDSHNNIRSLNQRHLDVDEDDFKLVFYDEFKLEDYLFILDSMAGILLGISKKVHDFFESDSTAQIDELYAELESMRSTYTSS